MTWLLTIAVASELTPACAWAAYAATLVILAMVLLSDAWLTIFGDQP